MKKIALIFSLSMVLSCKDENGPVVNAADYKDFLQPGLIAEEKKMVLSDIAFWNERLAKRGNNIVDLLQTAYARLKLFGLTRDAFHLVRGDSLLAAGSALLEDHDPEILFALCQNAISRHRFYEAVIFNRSAKERGGDPYINGLLDFDTKLELGNIAAARKMLASLKDKHSFDYLVRLSKLEDHEGRSGKSIALMEEAAKKIKHRNEKLYAWTLSNLGDQYGHSGKIRDAYRSYLSALKSDCSNHHALRGIAWIAYSHDQDPVIAKDILKYIQVQSPSPEIWLDLAEISEWEEDHQEKEYYARQFLESVKNVAAGDMYNKYLLRVYSDFLPDPVLALTIAEKEIKNRQTTETWSWLAGAYLSSGQQERALEIINNYVLHRTNEPATIYQAALILAANDKTREAKALMEESLASGFELGPLITERIKKSLALKG